MDLRETAFWARRLFPGAVRIGVRQAWLPGRRRRRSRPGIPVKVAEFSLYDASSDPDAIPDVADGSAGAFDGAPAAAEIDGPRREIAAFTVNFGRVDLGLRAPDGGDVRVEMFLVAYPDSVGVGDGADAAAADDSVVARAVAGAAALIADDPEAARPTPGSVIPDAVRVGLDAGQDSEPNAGQGSTAGQEAAEAESGFAASGSTTPHLLCVVPYVWPDGVPTITEEPGKISLHEDEGTAGFPDAVTGGARLTTVTQLVPITDAEYAHANERGVDSLMQMLAAADADLRDLRRASVVA